MKKRRFWRMAAVLLLLVLLAAGCWFLGRERQEAFAGATLVWRWETCPAETNCM